MKKTFIIICIIILAATALTGCKKEAEKDPVIKQVSFYHSNLYCGQNESFSITVERGMKEKEYAIDGKAGSMQEFAKLKVTPLNADLFDKDFSYSIEGKKGKAEGKLEKDIFGTYYFKDLEDIDTIGNIQNITIKSQETENKIILNDKIIDMLKWQDIINIVKENFSDAIATEIQNKNFNREIYVKFINDNKNIDSPYYWYVALIASKTDYWAMLIDPKTGSVITKKS